MHFSTVLVLAVGLAMDAMAVSVAKGLATPKLLARHVALVAGFFGGFQALMPLIGWVIGARAGHFAAAWAHWIAFALLGMIGGKMLWEALSAQEADQTGDVDPFEVRVLFVLAVATSIDALAAGVMLPMLGAPLATSLLTIGVTTAALSALGLFAGRRFGALLGKRLDAAGGVVLIGLGVKILVERLGGA